ncbi:hypothetical protein [Amnibacterium sp.]|uniref:hypothetical protein n=1 Tax=Amnibacterium sp. TaxID=1872496 RepID=UPI003F7C61F0
MTIAISPAAAPAPADSGISWRPLDTHLWVARRDGRHLGSVQEGHRWLAADADGDPIGSFRSFQEARAAVADPARHRTRTARPLRSGPVLAAAAFAAVGVVSALGWAWAALLL